MATISGGDSTKIFSLKKFLGLNESKDGDTQLRMGEASSMDNWRVTPQYHLRVRPGMKTAWSFTGAVRGLWSGTIGGSERLVCAADGRLYELTSGGKTEIGTLTDAPTTFFGFGGKLYILNGHEYLSWDGTNSAEAVEGYIPLVVTAAIPTGGGTTLQNVNRLTGKRRIRYSADGTAKEYTLPQKPVLSVDKVEISGVQSDTSSYTTDLTNGKITFTSAPSTGTNNVEIWYTVANTLRSQVEAMKFCETYNGSTDTRVFLYGDGTNKTIYSGLTEEGVPTAEYFPDLSEIAVDSANTPITGMIKQFSYLMIFKPNGAFSTQYSATTLTDGTVTAGFYVSPVNRELGNVAPGQVRLVYNYPRTLCAGNAYDWRTVTTGYDERRAKIMSERVAATLKNYDLSGAFCFDDNREQEYYIFLGDAAGTVLVHRYSYEGTGDVWYRYTGIPAVCGVRNSAGLYFGTSSGKVVLFSEDNTSDDGGNIDCVWKSGNMDFGADFQRKHSSILWVSLKPDDNARLTVTAQTDRKSVYTVKTAASSLSTFSDVDFSHFSFLTNRNPQMQRLKLKVKKFAFYKLILECNEDSATTDVLGVDISVRYTGYVK